MTKAIDSEKLFYQKKVTVDRSIEDCFTYLADLRNMVDWDQTVMRARKSSRGAIGLNTDFHIEYQMGPMSFDVIFEITAFSKPDAVCAKGECEAFDMLYEFVLSQKEGQPSEISLSSQIKLKGAYSLFKAPLGARVHRFLKKGIDRLVQTLAERPSFQPLTASEQLENKLIVPSLLKLSRFGYARKKRHWQPYFNSLKGKNVLITDGTSDLGVQLIEDFTRLGARVMFVSADLDKAERVLENAKEAEGEGAVISPIFEHLDLSLLGDVNKLAQKVHQHFNSLSVLVNNYGQIIKKRHTTKEGFEKSFASLLLGPFVLTESLHELLRHADRPKVINVISSGVYMQPIDPDDLESKKKPYNGFLAYARSRRGLLDMTKVWAKTWGEKNHISVHCVNPGWVDSHELRPQLVGVRAIAKPLMRNLWQASDSITWLASSPAAEEVNGLYWLDRRPLTESLLTLTKSSDKKQDQLYAALRSYQEKSIQAETGT